MLGVVSGVLPPLDRCHSCSGRERGCMAVLEQHRFLLGKQRQHSGASPERKSAPDPAPHSHSLACPNDIEGTVICRRHRRSCQFGATQPRSKTG